MAVTRRKSADFLSQRAEGSRRLRAAPPSPLGVLVGEPAFLLEPWIEDAVAGAGRPVEWFGALAGEKEGATLQRLLDLWGTASLFEPSRLLIMRGADRLLARKGGERLLEAAEDRHPPNTLLLTVAALDGRSRLAKRLRERDALFTLPPLRDSAPPWHRGGPYLETDLNLWVVDRARSAGLQAALDVADELTRRIGNEPARLAGALDQLAVLMQGRTRLTRQDVVRHVRRSSTRLLALYEDALRAGDGRTAIDHLDRMLVEGVQDHAQRLVSGNEAADAVLRGLVTSLARVVEAHERLGPGPLAALDRPPWERSAADEAVLADVLGGGGRRMFLERDLREWPPAGARAALRLALGGLRALRDGEGLSLHALTVRLARACALGARVRA